MDDHEPHNFQSHLHPKDDNKKEEEKEAREDRNGAKSYHLVSFWELPEYMKDNEYILRYYRADWPLKQALFSIFRWHNETLNVWTHLVGFFLFLGLTLANLMQPLVPDFFGLFTRLFGHPSLYFQLSIWNLQGATTQNHIDLKHQTPSNMELQSSETNAARWPFFVFLGGSMFCLLSSSICHLFSCHSHSLNLVLLRMDYVGITVMIITSFFPQIYYIFQCQPHWQFLYLGGITAMGLFTIVTLLSPSLATGKCRAFRSMLFSSMGLFGTIPATHASFVNWGNPRRNVALACECIMAFCYLAGTLFYVTRIPERWRPGWFDLAGHSHQIFHVLVVMGALAHYAASLKILQWRDTLGCGPARPVQ